MAQTSDARAAKPVCEDKPLLLSQGPPSNGALELLPYPQGCAQSQAGYGQRGRWHLGVMANHLIH